MGAGPESPTDVSAITGASDPAATDRIGQRAGGGDLDLRRGAIVGRYVLLAELGRGGMGVVHRAYDPELERHVAIKLLRCDRGEAGGQRARHELLREARALAELAHPNVVRVFDVGTRDERVWLAMELVEGADLSRWIRARSREWPEVVEVLAQAGRGLAAAHAAGIVHRDFKPSNVLVGRDGRVRVTDFGLAQRDVDDDAAPLSESSVAGTPPYLAPELHAGAPADARSDEYAFCVALFECLCGRRPFSAPTAEQLLALKRGGLPHNAFADAPFVPARIRRAIARGLSATPDARHRDMNELLADLGHGASRRRGRVGAAAVVALGLGIAGARVARGGAEVCGSGPHRMAAVWSDEREANIASAFAAAGVPWAADARVASVAALDRYAERWIAQHHDACAATWIRGEQKAPVLDRRMACLDRRLEDLAAAVERLEQADAGVVEHAVDVVQALPPVESCSAAASEREPARPREPGDARAVAHAHARLAGIRSAAAAGLFEEALVQARELAASTGPDDHAPTRAEVLLQLGRLLDANGDAAASRAQLEAAVAVARASAHDRAEIEAWIALMRVAGQGHRAAARVSLCAAMAQAGIAARGGDDELAAELALERGTIAFHEGDDRLAAEQYERAIALWTSLHGADDPAVANVTGKLAGVHFRAGDHERAATMLRQAIQAQTLAYGERHPRVAAARGNLGLVLASTSRFDEAIAQMEAARSILVEAFGEDHPAAAQADDSIGDALRRSGRAELAVPRFERALATLAKTLGPDHPASAAPLLGLGEALLAAGDPAAARDPLERALALATSASLPPIQLADTRFALARALDPSDVHQRARAHQLAREADSIYREVLTPDDDRLPEIDAFLARGAVEIRERDR
jgi:tetratricopeptide (TPR) repeat protein